MGCIRELYICVINHLKLFIMTTILLVIFTTATLTWAATSQRNNSKN